MRFYASQSRSEDREQQIAKIDGHRFFVMEPQILNSYKGGVGLLIFAFLNFAGLERKRNHADLCNE